MDSTALYNQFRLDVDDRVAPYLWSAAEVLDYIDDAQKMFCRLTGGFGDASSPLTLLTYAAGDTGAPLSPLVLRVRAAYDVATGAPIGLINIEDMATHHLRFDGRSGPLCQLVLGMEAGSVRLYPVPATAGSVRLVVERLPLLPVDDLDQALEVPDQHKAGLTLWMRARAYAKQDADTYDKKRSDEFAARFASYCALATQDKARARHKTRVVAYGGL